MFGSMKVQCVCVALSNSIIQNHSKQGEHCQSSDGTRPPGSVPPSLSDLDSLPAVQRTEFTVNYSLSA